MERRFVMITPEPNFVAPGAERETLAAVEALLRERRSALTFPDRFERVFETETLGRYAAEPIGETLKPVLLYNVFMIGDLLLTPDTIWLSAALHFLLVTPAMLFVAWLLRRGLDPLWRDLAGAAIPILVTFQVLAVFVASQAPMVSHYPYFVLMAVVCTNIAMKLRYRSARWATGWICVMLTATLAVTHKVPTEVAAMQCISLTFCGFATLGANFHMERDFRRAYLKKFRDRLRVAIVDAEANHDPLTGAANRRGLDDTVAELWRDGASEAPVSVILFDIDRFKSYNDIYGHQSGDDCLKRVATAVAAELRVDDLSLARFGGEEFLALLPNAREREAREIAERLRRAVVALGIRHSGAELGVISASFGVASAKVGETTFESLVAAADSALYAAKRNGRNMVAGRPSGRQAA